MLLLGELIGLVRNFFGYGLIFVLKEFKFVFNLKNIIYCFYFIIVIRKV